MKLTSKFSLVGKLITGTVYIGSIILMILSLALPKIKGEATIGDFSSKALNSGWIVSCDDRIFENVELPFYCTDARDKTVIMTNTLPEDIDDGINLMTRASLEDMFIYVDGTLRNSYYTDGFEKMAKYLPSAYIVTPLYTEDAGKTIEIRVVAKVEGELNGVTYAYGNNVWFEVIQKNLFSICIAFLSVVLGTGSVLMYLFILRKKSDNKAIFYMGLLTSNVGLWILSESEMRQLVFNSPSISAIFAYTLIDLVGVFVAAFFDEAQHRYYHNHYTVVRVVITYQMAVNIILQGFGVLELYETIFISHFLMIFGGATCAYCLIKDIRAGRAKNYSITMYGMIFILAFSMLEIAGFYLADFHSFSAFLGLGLLFLLGNTILQAVVDENKRIKERQEKQKLMLIETVETIANAIDAKDKYTGGHSKRVGEYAFILAARMAKEYKLTRKQVEDIRYIGKMHDIGKIGVPDNILTKPDRLSDEEFAVMKNHTVAGRELLSSFEGMPGLKDGIYYHHERYDGKGYPEGIKGEEIPLIARILCVADSYDAMTSDRPYRKRLDKETVREEFVRCSGTQFDPRITEIFIELMDEDALKIIE